MARSRKKNAIAGHTAAESEKIDKRFANRKFRKKFKNIVNDLDKLDEIEDDIRSVSNRWNFQKDGKHRYSEDSEWFEIIKRK